MGQDFSLKYELSSSENNFPARVILFDKPGAECFIEKHWHKTIEINYVINGNLKIKNDNSTIVKDNEYIIFNPHEVHSTDGLYKDEHIRFLVIILSYNFCKHYFPEFEEYNYSVNNKKSDELIKGHLKSIVNIIESNNELSELSILNNLICIINHLFSKCKYKRLHSLLEPTINDNDTIKIAIEFIKENYTSNLTLQEVSDKVALTPTYFSKLFKLKTNKTFLKYLNDIRMIHTLSDIQNYGYTETRAALNNGFGDVKSFIKVFKDNYNCTFSQYKKTHSSLPSVFGYDKFHEENRYL